VFTLKSNITQAEEVYTKNEKLTELLCIVQEEKDKLFQKIKALSIKPDS